MAELVEEQVIWVDADGHVVDDPDQAVRGEVTRTYDDGSTEHTLFVVNRAEQ